MCVLYSHKHSEAELQKSMHDIKHQNDFLRQSKVAGTDIGQHKHADAEMLAFGDADSEEKLSDMSDGGLSAGTETDGSADSMNYPESAKSDNSERCVTFSLLSLLHCILLGRLKSPYADL